MLVHEATDKAADRRNRLNDGRPDGDSPSGSGGESLVASISVNISINTQRGIPML